MFGEAPVHHEDFAEGSNHEIGGFQVAVDHAAVVSEGDGVADFLKDGEERGERVAFEGFGVTGLQTGEDFFQRFAPDKLHGVEGLPLSRDAQVINRDDVGVFKLARELGLPHKAHQLV